VLEHLGQNTFAITALGAVCTILWFSVKAVSTWIKIKIDYLFEQLFGSKDGTGWVSQFLVSHEKIAKASETQVQIGERLSENMSKLNETVSTLQTGLKEVKDEVKLLTHEVQELKGKVNV
jgi:hypothetical protein